MSGAGVLTVVRRPGVIRWAGAAGSVMTAVTAYLGGSGFTRIPSVNPVTLLRGDKGVALPLCWVLGTSLLLAAWWAGRHVVPSTRWALVTVGLWALPLLPFLPLGSADVYSYACQGYLQFAGGDPYAAGVQQQGCPWLGSVATVWYDTPAPYGALFLLLAAAAVAVGDTLSGVIGGLRVIALSGLALTAAGLPVLARRCGVDPARAVWVVLACPLVLVHLVSGAHNDALMVGLLVCGLAVVASRSTSGALVAGGALLGLAVSVKATAVVVLPFAVLAAVPPESSLRALWRPGAAIAGGATAALGVVSLLSGRGLGSVQGLLTSGDTVAWTSPPTALGLAVNTVAAAFGGHLDAVPAVRLAAVVLLAGVLGVLWWRARRDALLGAGLALGATVVCAPVFHPWYATWPLAVLAATCSVDSVPLTRWVLLPCAVAATLTTPAGYNWALATRTPGSLTVTAGFLVLAALAARRAFGGSTCGPRPRRSRRSPASAPRR
jgi:alpha-1,6-mannosyltransferase